MTRRLAQLLPCGAILCALVAPPAEAYLANTRWTGTASGLAGSQGSPVTLTWSIVPDGTDVPDLDSNLRNFLDANWGVGPGGADLAQRPWFSVFQQSFDRLGALSGVRYVYEPADDGADLGGGAGGVLGVRGDIRLGGKSYGAGSNTLATNYYPQIGDMMINTDRTDFFTSGANSFRYFRNTIMHEAMHGLGVDHVDSSTGILMRPFIGTDFDGPQLDDILALQRLYGDAREEDGGNESAATATTLGAVVPGQARIVGTLGNSTGVTAAQTDFVSIDDNLDSDYYSFTLSQAYNIFLLLQPRGGTYTIGPQGGAQALYNTRELGDLALVLLDSSGLTSLQSSNVSGAGGSESIQFQLNPGTYYTRVGGTSDDVQLYQLSVAASVITADALTWVGNVNSNWNVANTANFANALDADVFRNGDNVTFNDSTASRTVSVSEPVSPASMLVDTAATYVFTGAGITAGSLTKRGVGTAELTGAAQSAGDTIVEAGVLRLAGLGDLAGDYQIAVGGALEVAGGHAFTATSRLAGAGEVRGDIDMPGTIAPGGATVGGLSFADSLSLAATSVVEVDLAGLLPGSQYDAIAVGGDLALDGSLEVLLGAGFAPVLGAAFTILEATNVTGAFSGESLPGLALGLQWEIDYLPGEVVLKVKSASAFAAADFNDDGVVDGADLASWQAGYGDPEATRLDGDANGDSVVDGSDFLAWQRRVSSTIVLSATAVVPEPAAWSLAAVAGAMSVRSVRGRQRLNRSRRT